MSGQGLPIISGKDLVKSLERHGWIQCRQKGSHVSMKKDGNPLVITVPMHREIAPGTLRNILNFAGLAAGDI